MLIGTWLQRHTLTQQRIVEAAIQIAREGNLLELTISEVARRCTLTSPAIYKYFRDRAALLLEAQKTCCDQLCEVALGAARGDAAARDYHRNVWSVLIEFLLDHPGAAKILALPLSARDALLYPTARDLVWAIDPEANEACVREHALPFALVMRGTLLEFVQYCHGLATEDHPTVGDAAGIKHQLEEMSWLALEHARRGVQARTSQARPSGEPA